MTREIDLIRDGSAWPSIVCIGFTPASKPGYLRGWAELHLPRIKLRLHSCPCFVSNEGAWVNLPSKEIGKDAAGKARYAAQLEWNTRGIQDAFSAAAVAAVDAYAPAWREQP